MSDVDQTSDGPTTFSLTLQSFRGDVPESSGKLAQSLIRALAGLSLGLCGFLWSLALYAFAMSSMSGSIVYWWHPSKVSYGELGYRGLVCSKYVMQIVKLGLSRVYLSPLELHAPGRPFQYWMYLSCIVALILMWGFTDIAAAVHTRKPAEFLWMFSGLANACSIAIVGEILSVVAGMRYDITQFRESVLNAYGDTYVVSGSEVQGVKLPEDASAQNWLRLIPEYHQLNIRLTSFSSSVRPAVNASLIYILIVLIKTTVEMMRDGVPELWRIVHDYVELLSFLFTLLAMLWSLTSLNARYVEGKDSLLGKVQDRIRRCPQCNGAQTLLLMLNVIPQGWYISDSFVLTRKWFRRILVLCITNLISVLVRNYGSLLLAWLSRSPALLSNMSAIEWSSEARNVHQDHTSGVIHR